MKKQLSAHEKIIEILKRNNNRWMKISDLGKVQGDLFVGYEINTRTSDLVRSGELEARWRENKRFKEYRLKTQ